VSEEENDYAVKLLPNMAERECYLEFKSLLECFSQFVKKIVYRNKFMV
jgi:hypothetical protein